MNWLQSSKRLESCGCRAISDAIPQPVRVLGPLRKTDISYSMKIKVSYNIVVQIFRRCTTRWMTALQSTKTRQPQNVQRTPPDGSDSIIVSSHLCGGLLLLSNQELAVRMGLYSCVMLPHQRPL
ncbi:hypothetical protein SRHO_G00061850 [Serrasalmus rhombeus]